VNAAYGGHLRHHRLRAIMHPSNPDTDAVISAAETNTRGAGVSDFFFGIRKFERFRLFAVRIRLRYFLPSLLATHLTVCREALHVEVSPWLSMRSITSASVKYCKVGRRTQRVGDDSWLFVLVVQ